MAEKTAVQLKAGIAAAGITCGRDRRTGTNIYRIQGDDRTVMFDAADVPGRFTDGVDMLVLNNCSPDRMEYIGRIIEANPDIVLAGTAVTLNFAEEFLGFRISKRIIRHRERMDIGGRIIELIPVPNVNRSRHQDRTWKKSYRFLQMPNWQWIDSICIIVSSSGSASGSISGSGRILISGQLFSSRDGQSREDYFRQKLRPFIPQVSKTIKLLEKEEITAILPESGEILDFATGMNLYSRLMPVSQTAGGDEAARKLIVIPYVSEFGCTGKLAEAIAAGASQVPGISTQLTDLTAAELTEAVREAEQADGIAIGTPTVEDDAAEIIMRFLAEASVSGFRDKTATAFGSYSYAEKGVTNALCRMKQLGMMTTGEGFAVRFLPDEADLKEAQRFGEYFAKCTAAGEILPREECSEDDTTQTQAVCTDRRFIIIGNGAAGTAAAEELRKLDAGCSIELISREKYRGYNRQMLTRSMLRKVPEQNMFLYRNEWYETRNIISTLGREVTAIDAGSRRITLDGGETKQYDGLIIATGADPVRADVPGKELQGIFCIHDLPEMDEMREYIATGEISSAVILGGGIMGLETAADLAKSGIHITICESGPHLMPKQLDETAGRMLEERLVKAGIAVVTSETAAGFEGNEHVSSVVMQSGLRLDAQLVIQCLGIKANGVPASMSDEPGIRVNDRMETGMADVYACGDCAVHNGVNYGLWTQAVQMARVAARSAAENTSGGREKTGAHRESALYRPVVPAVTFTGFGMSVFAVGDNGRDRQAVYQTKEVRDPAEGTYRKLCFKNRKFCGGILFGDVDMTTELIEAYEEGTLFENISI